MIQVTVGTGEGSKTFFVYRDLITSRSRFFAKALKTYGEGQPGEITWTEGAEGIVKLPEDDAEVFTNYLHLVYLESIPIRVKVKGAIALSRTELDHAVERAVDNEYTALSKLYVFCEKLGDPHGKALVITAFVQATLDKREDGEIQCPGPGAINIVYGGTMQGDPLRKFCVNLYALVACTHWFANIKAYDHDLHFIFDVMVAMADRRKAEPDDPIIASAEPYVEMLQVAESKASGEQPRTSGSLAAMLLSMSSQG
jgi:hypothetical protein